MYYQTQVKKIRAGSVVDVNGKVLYSIGNFSCKEGDFVWTDGQFVFGHTPARSTPLIIFDNPGIPVSFVSARGYITKNNCTFKPYSISADDWIVNTDKNFASGNTEIIDAEIDDNGDLWTVTNGFYRFKSAPTFHNHLYTQGYRALRDNDTDFSIFQSVTPYIGQLFDYPAKSFNNIPAVNTNVVFYRNGVQKLALNLKQYADLAEAFALDAKDIIMSRSIKDNAAVNWTRQPAPPDDFIALSYAAVVSMHVSRNGDWDAIISASAIGYCFPYLTFDGSIFNVAFKNDEDKTFSTDLISCINNFEDVVFNSHTLPFQPSIEKYPDFEGDEKDDNDEYTPEFQEYILAKVAYYIPLARFKYYYWFPIVFSACKILRVHNGTVTDTIYQSHGGGNVIYAPDEWDEAGKFVIDYDTFVYNYNTTDSPTLFPVDDNVYCRFSADHIIFYDKNSNVVHDLTSDWNGYKAYGKYQGYYYSLIDSVAYNISSQPSIDINNLFGRQIFIPALSYDIAGLNVQSAQSDNPLKDNYPYMSGWFKNPNNDDDDANISCCFLQLPNDFLFGVRGENLYKKHGSAVNVAGSGLKNFRLRELKNISNARK